ncbi:MAG: type VI secretion system-associated protein TagF [Desulfosarcinaceae bacterium]|nr:type VI secretion system-associated protein TagF [Desulfosarcinaceae bacterium]
MDTPDTTPGFYGKIPSQTDFTHRRLPATFVRPWENWLQASLRTSQKHLGKSWLDTYLSSPVWRFVLQVDVCGADAWAGVMMPSVDLEGRCFPLTLAACIKPALAEKKVFDQADQWFALLERFVLASLADDFDPQNLDDLLLRLTPFPQRSRRFPFARVFARRIRGGSLWQTRGYDHSTLDTRAFQGLPTPQEFIGLLSLSGPPEPVDDTSADATATAVSVDADQTQTLLHQGSATPASDQTAFRWRSWAVTDVGRRREINEDAYLNKPEAGLWVVADGMGGHSAGDVASQTVTKRLDRSPGGASLTVLEQNVRATLHAVNAELLTLAAEMGPGHVIGTTVVALLASGESCAALWAGDSRLYRFRDGTLAQLTIDHSMAVELANAATTLPKGYAENIVTRALGADATLELDRIAFTAEAGDYYLLCSDGLTKELHPAEIETIFSSEAGDKALRRMLALALERQARDNITVILISAEPI